MNDISFIKMQGLGNDFIIIDSRNSAVKLAQLNWRKLADRRLGVGCDQIIILSKSDDADSAMRIINADGSEVDACGNATRCVGKLLLQETSKSEVTIRTNAGLLKARKAEGGAISAVMPPPGLSWQDIPLSEEMDTLKLPIEEQGLKGPCAVSIGNPHMVFLADDVEKAPIDVVGAVLEHHALFPQRTNVEVVQIDSREHITMRVWERGVGLTQACGTGACASLVAAVRLGLTERKATVKMPGGALDIEWLSEEAGGSIIMTGEACEIYRGTFDFSAFLA